MFILTLLACLSALGGAQSNKGGEVEVLLELKKSFYDNHTALFDWTLHNSLSMCYWTGIQCHSLNGHVVSLQLGDMGLNGTIPPMLSELTHLQILNLSYNSLTGPIPESLGQLQMLQILVLSENWHLNASIPASLCNCTRLEVLDLKNVGHTPDELAISNNEPDEQSPAINRLPECIGQLHELRALDLSGNAFTKGRFPSFITMLSQLEYLSLAACNLEGTVPLSLGKLDQLKHLDLSSNNLMGPIPFPLFLNWTVMEKLDLSDNKLSGEIPASIGHLKNLHLLALSKNNFTGNFVNISGCTKLEILDLRYNSLYGYMLTQVAPLKKLQYLGLSNNDFDGELMDPGVWPELGILDLSGNKFSGSILTNWISTTKIKKVDLSLNNFTGIIPANWSISISWLDLSHNTFYGTIPDICSEGGQLAFLDLSGNELFGEVPSSFGKCSKLRSLQLCYNSLHGRLPSSLRNCSVLQEFKADWNKQLEDEIFKDFPVMLPTNLEIAGNRFSGDISMISNNFSYRILNLAHNDFTGNIPEAVCSWKQLLVLSLAFNNVSGSIPSCIGNLTSLQLLDLSNNHLSGNMPQGLEHLTRFQDRYESDYNSYLRLKHDGYIYFGDVEILDGTIVSDKHAFGMVKSGVSVSYKCLLRDLKLFDVSNNLLDGNIPSSLGQLIGIRFLNLSHNSFSGTIPWELGNISGLLELDLSHNQLHGYIPSSISQDLSSFSVAYNNLSGPIPTSNFLNTKFNVTSYEGNPGLYGCPLTSCSQSEFKTSSEHVDQNADKDAEGLFDKWSFNTAALLSFSVAFWIRLLWA